MTMTPKGSVHSDEEKHVRFSIHDKDDDDDAAHTSFVLSPSPPSTDVSPISQNNIKTVEDEMTPSPTIPPLPGPPTRRFSSKELRGNLTRELKDRDPLFYYEIVSVLGTGSMGSVSKVRKRQAVLGGSARTNVQEWMRKEKRIETCFNLPVLGGMFERCFKGWLDTPQVALISTERTSSIDDSSQELSHSYQVTYAMKTIHLKRVIDETYVEELKNEVSILRSLDHPHIVRCMETFQHRHQIFVCMELLSGGDLYRRDPYTEEEAARIVSSILSAVAYMHSKGVLHRDLKYENCLFVSDAPQSEVKLIDFGLSKKFGKEELTEGVGTIYTMAPEVLRGSYTKQADLWSVGVMAYMLVSSQLPFYGRKKRHLVERIRKGQYEFRGRRWTDASSQAMHFVQDLLQFDPDQRATAEEALGATWLNRRFGASVRSPRSDEMDSARNSMIKFADYSRLRKVALMVVAHKSTSEEIGILRKVFQEYDKNRDGTLNYQEFKAAITQAGYTDDDYRKIFDAVDMDGSGSIRYTEFLAATIEAQGAINEERLAEAFDRLDADDSGYISAANLKEMLGAEFEEDDIDAIIKEADKTDDGKISYAEFLALWEDQNEQRREEVLSELSRLFPAESFASQRTYSVGSSSRESSHDAEEVLSRASFIQQKAMSVRRTSRSTRTTAPLSPDTSESGKHVVFQETVTTIPEVGPNDHGEETAATV